MTHREIFTNALIAHFEILFKADDKYKHAVKIFTPRTLAETITSGILAGAAFIGGPTIQKTCSELCVEYTHEAIQTFLTKDVKL